MTPADAWSHCMTMAGKTGPHATEIGDALLLCWQEQHRHYHGIKHAEACTAAWARFLAAWREPVAVGLALLYHDAVYYPRKGDNEAASARLAVEQLAGLGFNQDLIGQVQDLIQASDHQRPSVHPDADLMRDVDLAILGSDPACYLRYVEGIRQEYDFVDEDGWRNGRSAVIRCFLARPRVFLSDVMTRLELPARRNLQDELVRIQA